MKIFKKKSTQKVSSGEAAVFSASEVMTFMNPLIPQWNTGKKNFMTVSDLLFL